ncbi:hypothetical protein BH23PAT2_BH23PAT2_03350 [soil metagenome]
MIEILKNVEPRWPGFLYRHRKKIALLTLSSMTLSPASTPADVEATEVVSVGSPEHEPVAETEAEMDPRYRQLLETILKHESGGYYNAIYGNAGNESVPLTSMTVAEVLHWQQHMIDSGGNSPAGYTQIIKPTLEAQIITLDIDPQALFDEVLQDRIAISLLELRGVNAYLNGDITTSEFAYNLSQEWAALPRVIDSDNPGDSYYAGVGNNQAHTPVEEIITGLEAFRQDVNATQYSQF